MFSIIKSPLSSFNSRPLKIVEVGFVDVVPNYLSENGEDVAVGLDANNSIYFGFIVYMAL